MDATAYLQTLAKIESKIEQERLEKVRSLNEIWALYHGSEPPPKPINSHADAVLEVRGEWREVVRQIIGEMPRGNRFKVKDIKSGIAAKSPHIATHDSYISMFLKSIATAGELNIAEPGSGGRATIYAKK